AGSDVQQCVMMNRCLALLAVAVGCLAQVEAAKAGLWITGYYPEYEDASQGGPMVVSDIDFTTVTHAVHFCLLANTDGSFSENGLTPSVCSGFVRTVHNAGRKALVCVGGAGSETGFQ